MRFRPGLTGLPLRGADPQMLAIGVGCARFGFGLAALLAPRVVPRHLMRSGVTSPDAVTAWRMAGGRDVVLAMGVFLAAMRGSPTLRDWLQAGAVADAIDVAALAFDDALHPPARLATALIAGSGAITGVALAGMVRRRLGPPSLVVDPFCSSRPEAATD